MDKIWFKAMNLCAPTCHQMPSRSFFINKKQMPVCSRCLGLYIGYLIGVIVFIISIITDTYFSIPMSIIFILPMALDGTIQYFTNYESNNFRRLLTGILAGTFIIQFLGNIVVKIFGLF